jgi:hypothetical protein
MSDRQSNVRLTKLTGEFRMKSICQVNLDEIMFRMRYLLEDDYPELKQQDVIDALSYDHDYAQFRAKELSLLWLLSKRNRR